MIKELLDVAKREIGYKEGKNNDTKYGKWYGLNYNSWCAMFVSWCVNQAKISTSIVPKFASCSQGVKLFKEKNQFKDSKYTPRAGDLIFFEWNGNKADGADHVGIVEKVEGNTITTIEGNRSDKVERFTYKVGHSQIMGYGTPDYPENKVEVNFLDYALYNAIYEDLQKAFKGDINSLKLHYNQYGKKEGRRCSYVFDPVYYLNKYADLKKAYKNDYVGAYNHYVECGISEGRQGSEIFDPIYYKENNVDLKNMNNYELVNHFLVFGIKEGRITSKEFDVKKYKNNYTDLQKAFGNNYQLYYTHYLTNGKNEGRKGI